MKKKIISLIICLCMILSLGLVGCKNKNDDSGKKPTPEPPTPTDPTDPSDPSDKPTENNLTITSPNGTVYSFNSAISAYLSAGENESVSSYAAQMNDQAQAVNIEWTDKGNTADSYVVEYGLKDDFSDAVSVTVDGDKRRIKVYNLYKASTYHVRVTAKKSGEEDRTVLGTFSTQTNGPRVMKIDGIINVRDIGGYTASNGKTIKQGLIFRGSCLSPSKDKAYTDIQLTDEAKAYMSETLKIKSDFDLRSAAMYTDLTQSPIPNAKITFFGISGYADAFTDTFKENYRKLFSALANKDNYPIYIHCDAGADRTGTAMILLEHLLDMKWIDIKHDYEFTTFSRAGVRSMFDGAYVSYINAFNDGLLKFDGNTEREMVENYLLSIGVTAEEISNIRKIMYGEIEI